MTAGPPRAAPGGLGDLDDAVSDIRHLRLGGAVGERNVGIDALGDERSTGQLGYSVETRRVPRCSARSARVRYGDASATASTTRMGFEVAFEYSSWPSDTTSAPRSSIQSRP